MQFAGMNYLAILLAAVAGFLVGMGWYMALGQHWMKAIGKTEEDIKKSSNAPFIVAIISLLIMATMLAGTLGHLGEGQVTLRNGVITGALMWLGFVVTTMAVNHAFQGASKMLTVIDAGHWLAVLIVMGGVIGIMGV